MKMKYFLTDGGGYWTSISFADIDEALKACQLTNLLYMVSLAEIKRNEQLRLVALVAQNQIPN